MPPVPGPEGLADVRELPPDVLEKVPEKMRRFLTHERPFEFRPVEPIHVIAPPRAAPVRHIWVKTVDTLPDNADLHRNVLAYVSDYQLVSTATLPHGIHFAEGNVQLASLDHAMWFHRPFRVDEWLLYAMESPNASGGRGLAMGQILHARRPARGVDGARRRRARVVGAARHELDRHRRGGRDAVLRHGPARQHPGLQLRAVALRAATRAMITARELVIALVIMLVLLFAGTAILDFLGLTQPSLNIAGGVLLFIIALRMIFPQRGPRRRQRRRTSRSSCRSRCRWWRARRRSRSCCC